MKIRGLLLLFLLLTGCEKEIKLDYNSIEKLPVIEGRLTNETTEISITYTRDMEDPVKGTGTDGAVVIISDGNGINETLIYGDNGYYYSPSGLTGQPGSTYTLSVTLNGQEYISYSTMQNQALIKSTKFEWVNFMNARVLMYAVEVEDIIGEENYYYYNMYRNGENYMWDVFSDKRYTDDVIVFDIYCMIENISGDNMDEDPDEILYDGDIITLEVKTIDKRTYDYLYSLLMSDRTSTNPIDNFTGGCLGYFSAHSVVRWEEAYKKITN